MLHTWSRTLKLSATEFIRRYLLHVLPERFVKIRYYGLLGNRRRVVRIEQCRRLLGCRRVCKKKTLREMGDWRKQMIALTGRDPGICQICGGHMVLLMEFGPQFPTAMPP